MDGGIIVQKWLHELGRCLHVALNTDKLLLSLWSSAREQKMAENNLNFFKCCV